jgi:hypothetical protein
VLSAKVKAHLCYAVSALLLACAGYCALWFVSSASLACVACNCEYSLLASQLRCRQPVIAGVLAVALLLGSAAAAVLGYKLTRQRRSSDA